MEVKKVSEKKPERPDVAGAERTETRPRYTPPTDIYEKEDGLVLLMDMPGVDEKNVEVKLEEGVLSVLGRVEPEDCGDRRLVVQEYGVGDYMRSFTVNEAINTQKIEAELHNGVLTIFLPKAEEAKPRKIPVKAV